MSEERYVTLAEVKDMLEAQARDRELSPEQKISLDQANKNVKLSLDKAKKLVIELRGLGFVPEALAAKMADLLPANNDDVRVLFAKERSAIDKKQIEQIIKLVEQYL